MNMLYKLWKSLLKKQGKKREIPQSEIEKVVEETFVHQQQCAHQELIRFGPSYSPHRSGYRKRNEGTICRDCSYTQDVSHLPAMRSDFEMDY